MRPALLFSLVLLFLFVEAQGIRLEKGLISVVHQIIHVEKNRLIEVEEDDGGGSVGDVLCRDGHCLGSSRRNCLTRETSTTTTTTTSKTKVNKIEPESKRLDPKNRKKEKVYHKSSSVLYPDIIDIAGMDYSTAKKKAPIHN